LEDLLYMWQNGC